MAGANGVILRKLALMDEVLAQILRGHLDDFARFREEILAHVRREG